MNIQFSADLKFVESPRKMKTAGCDSSSVCGYSPTILKKKFENTNLIVKVYPAMKYS